MARNTQQNFFEDLGLEKTSRTTHGGDVGIGKRKGRRPLDSKRPIHLFLRSSKAKGDLSFRRWDNQNAIERIIRKQSIKYGVKIQECINVGSHLHLRIRFKYREGFQNFLRTVTAMIARAVTKAKRGAKFGKFWDRPAFTRVLKSRLEELNLKTYLNANLMEAEFGSMARETYLAENKNVHLRKKYPKRKVHREFKPSEASLFHPIPMSNT